MNDEIEPESERAIIREAEYVGLWMLIRSGYRRMGKGVRGLHRHHFRVWSILAALFWLMLSAACFYGVYVLIHIQTTERACQLMGKC